jgi:uncharacterized protein YneF (UPF0154 family)
MLRKLLPLLMGFAVGFYAAQRMARERRRGR